MSSGTGHTGGPPTMPWIERAAREAIGAHREAASAHQDTSEILKMLCELDAEADPLAAISEGQLLTIDRQTKLLELLRTVLEEVRQIRAEQDRHGLEMQALGMEVQTLKTRCDETYDRLVRATTRPAQPTASPKPA